MTNIVKETEKESIKPQYQVTVQRDNNEEIISEIEYGLSSGIFEFKVLNENDEQSLKELREAAAYAFK